MLFHSLLAHQSCLQIAVSLSAVLSLLAMACGPGTPPIVFTSDRDGNLEIYSAAPSGGSEVNLTNTPEDEFAPVVSPDRRMAAFQSGSGEDNAIEIISLDGKERKQMTQDVGLHSHQRWAPSSRRMVYVVENGQEPSIYVANADGSNPLKLTSIAGHEVGDWAKSGDTVLFAVHGGSQQGIYLRNPDGVNERRLTDTPDYSPAWALEEHRIAFLSTRDGNPEIYVMDVVSGEQTRLTETETPEYHISWSPNGRQLLFVSEQNGNPEIYVMNPDGSGQNRLTHNGVRDEQPEWSPSGTQIAFVSYLDGDAEIFVMDADGGNQMRITNNEAQDIAPSW